MAFQAVSGRDGTRRIQRVRVEPTFSGSIRWLMGFASEAEAREDYSRWIISTHSQDPPYLLMRGLPRTVSRDDVLRLLLEHVASDTIRESVYRAFSSKGVSSNLC